MQRFLTFPRGSRLEMPVSTMRLINVIESTFNQRGPLALSSATCCLWQGLRALLRVPRSERHIASHFVPSTLVG